MASHGDVATHGHDAHPHGVTAALPLEHCGHCDEPTMQRCHGCLNMRYCSVRCQKHDWKNHRLLCKTFGDFTDDQRPSEKHRRAIVFLPEEERPKFIWLEFDAPEEGSEVTPQEEDKYLGKGRILNYKVIDCFLKHNRRLDHPIMQRYDDEFFLNGSPVNQAVHNILAKYDLTEIPNNSPIPRPYDDKWCGNFLFHGLERAEDEDSELAHTRDLDTRALGPILDYFIVKSRKIDAPYRLHSDIRTQMAQAQYMREVFGCSVGCSVYYT